MNCKTIALCMVTAADFASPAAKAAEICREVEHAAAMGADMAVLPEAVNLWRGDGIGNPHPLSPREASECADEFREPVTACAQKLGIALALPLYTPDAEQNLRNRVEYFDGDGTLLGFYDKICLPSGELHTGVVPGAKRPPVIDWQGIKLGSAICFDTNFEDVFAAQSALGAEFFIVPSLWCGGSALNYYAMRYSVKIAVAYPAWCRFIDVDGSVLAEDGERNEMIRYGFGGRVLTARLNFDSALFHSETLAACWRDLEAEYGRDFRFTFDHANTAIKIESLGAMSVAELQKRCHLEKRSVFLTRQNPYA